MQCPFNTLFSEGRAAGRETTNRRKSILFAILGVVNGKTVTDIVLDTGCTRTLAHDRLVPVRQKTKGAITICCAYWESLYPSLLHPSQKL